MAKIDHFIGGLTTEETKQCAEGCLSQLEGHEAVDLIIQWLDAEGLTDELLARLAYLKET